MNTELLNSSTKDELQKICILIDQYIATWISDDDVTIENNAKEKGTFVRCARRHLPRNISMEKLVRFGKRIMYSVQSHSRCSFTCFKNKASWASCRLAKPSIKSLLTKFWKLLPLYNALGELQLPHRSDDIEEPIQNDVLPLKKRGILWLDQKRVTDVDANLVDGNPLISATFG